ncbi:MAG: hypothetical protein IZT59_03520 [Verrucomicrobia bacterium]|jgi:hypothetical protein|nr:hypothetical protein [Verrucomicrobiota bacterium]|tara:strand:+ start:13320 stop:13685 length:366 start_codon:yes stop_codon:yes gene_type:complete
MNRSEERILQRTHKAGVKFAKKEGHIPTRDELLELKIQVVSNPVRWLCFGGSVMCGIAAWFLSAQDNTSAASALAVVSFIFLIFSIVGIRRTLETLADQASYELVDAAFELIGGAVGSIFD